MSDGLKLIAKLLEDSAISGFRELQSDMFIDDERDVFRFVREHYRRYGTLPNIDTVEDETGSEFPETPETTEYYKARLADRQTYNSLRSPFGDLRAALSDNDMDAARVAIGTLQGTVRATGHQQDLRNIQEIGDSRLRYALQQRERSGMSGITTGWPQMDLRLGGYQNGDLITWAARPGMGKTYYLLHQAMAAWRAGHNVLFTSMEMTLDQLGNRIFGMQANVNARVFRDGRMSSRYLRSLRQVVRDIENPGNFNMYAGNFKKNVEDLEHLIHEMNPDIIYIDGVYLMSTEANKRSGRYEKAADVFDYLKMMTITHHRPIVVTTKFSKDAGKGGEEGSLENIGYTDTVGTHSSIVMALKEGAAPHQTTQRRVVILKGREGEEGTYNYNFSFNPMDFGEVEADTEAYNTDRLEETRRRREASALAAQGQDWTPNAEGED